MPIGICQLLHAHDNGHLHGRAWLRLDGSEFRMLGYTRGEQLWRLRLGELLRRY